MRENTLNTSICRKVIAERLVKAAVIGTRVFGALAAIEFKGGLAMESFINMPPEIANGLSVWRPVAPSFEEVMDRGLPFLRNKAASIPTDLTNVCTGVDGTIRQN